MWAMVVKEFRELRRDRRTAASGSALRAAAPTASVAGLLSAAEIDAEVSTMPASLEEAFVAIVAGPTTE